MKELIKVYTLQNALKFNGKANPGAVIGKIIAEKPELKKNIKEIAKKVNETILEMEKLTQEQQKELLKKYAPTLLEKRKRQEKVRTLPDLKNTKNLVMRFEPSPSGPLHIGHAYVLSLNSEYCRKYKGKLILRLGDTNPEKIYPGAYELIEKDAKWVTKNNISKVLVQSDRLEIYYKHMEKLLALEKAYVCTCNPERYKELITKQEPCPCRALKREEQEKRWKNMFTLYKQGEAVVRIKTDLKDKNPAMRDFPVFRINDSKHPKKGNKYRVWPLMNMAVTVDDIETKVTSVIRAKDHHDNAMRQKYIYDYLKKPFPEAIFVGRINFKGMAVSCSKTLPLIKDKTYTGWDDIRLPFLEALKRRGYQPDALIKYANDVGISLNDKSVTKEEFFKTIDAFNKDVIDPSSSRYFFIANPKEITIRNAPKQDLELDLHPENKKGGRKFRTGNKFYIAEEDLTFIEGKIYRLMDCLNFIQEEGRFLFHSVEYRKYKEDGEKIIHWLPSDKGELGDDSKDSQDDLVKVEVLMPDNKLVRGLGEKGLNGLKEGEVCQMERYGFVRLDKKEKDKLTFWFAHK